MGHARVVGQLGYDFEPALANYRRQTTETSQDPDRFDFGFAIRIPQLANDTLQG
jgi:hypothetical protein